MARATTEQPAPDRLEPDEAPRPWRPSPGGVAARLGVLAVLIGFLLLVPHLIPGTLVPVAARAVVYAIVALSMNVLVGYAGQISLGHQAFVGFGAFAAAYVLTTLEMPYPAALVAAVASGGIVALLLGAIALRVSGLYLALVTIAYALFMQESVFNLRAFTGGGAGLTATRPDLVTGNIAYVYYCAAFLALVWIFDWRLTSSKAGRAIKALRDDERVAASWGINITGYKILAFVISGAIAGLAGILSAGIEEIVSPEDFGLTLGFTFVLMTVVGGLGIRSGVVQGGVIFAILPTVLEEAHANWHVFPFTTLDALWEPLIGALLLLLTLIAFPGGIAQQQTHLRRWLSFGPFHEEPSGAADELLDEEGAGALARGDEEPGGQDD